MGEAFFPDQNEAFAAQAESLKRRRALAQQLIQQGMEGNSGSGYQGGKVFIVGNPLGNIAQSIGGQYLANKADTDQATLEQGQRQREQDVLSSIPSDPGPDRQQAQLRALQQMPSLRDVLRAQMGFDEAEANRIERGEQSAADRVSRSQEAEAARIERGEQQAADRVARSDDIRLRASTPNVNVRVSGGGAGPGFKVPAGYMLNAAGDGVVPIPGSAQADKANAPDKPLNENQGNAVLYGSRAGEANRVMEKIGTNYSPIKTDMAHATTNVPGVGSLVNAGIGENEQQVVQAQRDFVNAVMRRESGAAIAPSEFSNARKQYFPQPGDSDKVLAQKKANRELVIAGLAEVSGPAGKKAIAAITPKAPKQSDTLTPAEQAELDQLRAKHGRK